MKKSTVSLLFFVSYQYSLAFSDGIEKVKAIMNYKSMSVNKDGSTTIEAPSVLHGSVVLNFDSLDSNLTNLCMALGFDEYLAKSVNVNEDYEGKLASGYADLSCSNEFCWVSNTMSKWGKFNRQVYGHGGGSSRSIFS